MACERVLGPPEVIEVGEVDMDEGEVGLHLVVNLTLDVEGGAHAGEEASCCTINTLLAAQEVILTELIEILLEFVGKGYVAAV